jgi:Asp-tRNA(Asn)/Glu-tRNA(Gln) amidotransferase A subunit family amidase
VTTSDATHLATAVRSGEVTANETVASALDAARAAEHLNLFTLLDVEGAGAAARRVDAIVAQGGDPGPLAGVPLAVKDLFDQQGLPTTCGSSFYREVPTVSATVVDRLEAAGAVIVGRTGLHEFAYGFSSENPWFGPVRNPLDPATSPGGSSGGSAAAVAAGVIPIGIGTDTGGSVRVPSALCGVVGLKVTHGRIPLTGVFPLAGSVDTVGPITASVADAALAYTVLAGHDPRDPWSVDRPVGRPGPEASLHGTTAAIPHPWIDRPLEAGIARGWATAVDVLAAAGVAVHHLDAPDLDPEALPSAVWAEAAAVHRRWFSADPSRYGEEVRRRLAPAMEVTVDDYVDALRWRARLRGAFSSLFRSADVVVTPTTAARRKVIGEPMVDGGAGPEPYRRALSWFSTLVNQAGLPALSVPIGEGTPPPSLQMIAPWWAEARLLEFGQAVEAATRA